MESDLGCMSRIFFDNVTPSLHNVTLMSQKPYQNNNKCDCLRLDSILELCRAFPIDVRGIKTIKPMFQINKCRNESPYSQKGKKYHE